MDFPLISIILPTFERSEFTAKAIDSVVSQSYNHWELVIIDDGSKDGTWFFLQSQYPCWQNKTGGLIQTNKTIQCFKNENRGVSYSRNFGVSKSKGAWICFLDSDDVWLERKLENQMNLHMHNSEYRISQTKEQWVKKGNEINTLPKLNKISGNFFEEALELCLITPSSVMMKRALWDEMGGFREELPACEDYDLWLRILVKGEKVGLMDEILMKRNGGHADQLSNQFPAMERFRIYSQVKLLIELSRERNQEGFSLLREKNRMLIQKSLHSKLTIMRQGREKRGKSLLKIDSLLLLAKAEIIQKNDGEFNSLCLFLLNHDEFK